jgi:nucleoside-diphosphate-sugar epimerase
VVLRTSRFFPEEDVVSAHVLAMSRAPELGFLRCIVSATTPFSREECAELLVDAPAVLAAHHPGYEAICQRRGWRMFSTLGRVYVNSRAREQLGWQPRHDFASVLRSLGADGPVLSSMARAIGSRGYHRSSPAS